VLLSQKKVLNKSRDRLSFFFSEKESDFVLSLNHVLLQNLIIKLIKLLSGSNLCFVSSSVPAVFILFLSNSCYSILNEEPEPKTKLVLLTQKDTQVKSQQENNLLHNFSPTSI